MTGCVLLTHTWKVMSYRSTPSSIHMTVTMHIFREDLRILLRT